MRTIVGRAAYNLRFGASGGVSRPKVSAALQVLHPVQTTVSRRLRQAAGTLAVILLNDTP